LKSVAALAVRKGVVGERPIVNLENVASGLGSLVGECPIGLSSDMLAFEVGDVLFSKLRPYLAKSFLVAQPMFGTAEFLSIVPGPLVDARFLRYVTLSEPWVDWANATSYGTKMPRTSWEAMGEFRLDWPSHDQQRHIADWLDDQVARLDRAVQLRDRQIGLATEWRASALGELFAGDWTLTRLKHLVRRGISYGVLVPRFVENGGVRLIRVSDLEELPKRADALVQIETEQSLEYRRTVVSSGDVLVTVVGATAGKAAVVPEIAAGSNVSRAIARLQVAEGSIDSRLLWGWTLTPDYWRQVELAISNATAQPLLNIGDLSNFQIRVPINASESARASNRVGEIVETHARLSRAAVRSSALLREKRQALITAAVTGQFDVTTARSVA
jgi:type I restriction enzyme S subunit